MTATLTREPAARQVPAEDEPAPRAIALGLLLAIGGALGLISAFALTLDKIAVLSDPHYVPSCNLSVLVQCGKNLGSWQGSVFGFPNPLIGLVGFPAAIFMGVATLAGVRFPRWIWALFNVGMAFAIGFVAWLISQSVFSLATLCPWCMVVWIAVIPMSIAVTLFNLRQQNLPLGPGASRVAGALLGWTPLISLACYLIVAVVAQVRLDVLATL